jgi:hypothetical protein
LSFYGDTWVADHQRDAIRLEVRPERGSGLWFLEAKEGRPGFDHRHLGAKACEGLPELDANHARSEDRQRGRQLSRNRRLAVGPELDGLQARERWDYRGAAVGDHHRASRNELAASDFYSAQVRQFPFTSKQPGSGRLHRGSRAAVVEVARHQQHPFRDLGKVDGPFHS